MLPRALFFDLDQTLIQHSRSIGAVLKESLGRLAPERTQFLPDFGIELAASGERHWEGIAYCAGQGEQLLEILLAEALSGSGFDPGFATHLLKDLLQGITASTRPTNNALATLDTLRDRGMPIGVITNGLTILQTAKMRAHGLYDRVDAVVTSEDAGAHKPCARIFAVALAKLGVTPAEAWHVGDNHDKDIVGAHNAGMTGILFAPPATPDADRNHADRHAVGRLDAGHLDRDQRVADKRVADTLGRDCPQWDCPVINDLLELTVLVAP